MAKYIYKKYTLEEISTEKYMGIYTLKVYLVYKSQSSISGGYHPDNVWTAILNDTGEYYDRKSEVSFSDELSRGLQILVNHYPRDRYNNTDYITKSDGPTSEYMAKLKESPKEVREMYGQAYSADSYLYKRVKDNIKGAYIEEVILDESYPIDGKKGNYWYVRSKRLFPNIRYKDNTGRIKNISSGRIGNKEISNIYYKDNQGIIQNIQ